jgi:hypothetical protein
MPDMIIRFTMAAAGGSSRASASESIFSLKDEPERAGEESRESDLLS